MMPDDFKLPENIHLWMPLTLDDASLRLQDESSGLSVMARLKPGITLEQAQADIGAITLDSRNYPEKHNQHVLKVVSLYEARLNHRKITDRRIEIKLYK